MTKSRRSSSAATLLIASLSASLVTTACVWPSPERQFLLDFFQACRVADATVVARMATTGCNPATFGVVDGFDLIRVESGGTRKTVTIDTRLHSLAGERREATIDVELEEIDGRWMVTKLTPPPASQTSPAASSDPPK